MGFAKQTKDIVKRVLIIGLGSIGQRHAHALLALGVKNIAALRTGLGNKLIDDILIQQIKMFTNGEDAFNWEPTHIIISNPTSQHKKFIDMAIQSNVRFLVEKPIADNFRDINNQTDTRLKNGIVGYNLRFHGLFRFIKNIISKQLYGKAITAKMHVGQYLPNWHPYEDYRQAYYSQKALGGGAVRTLSHEIDLAQYFFGNITSVFAKIEKLSNLDIDVDDVSNLVCTSAHCQQIIIHMNFLDPKITRQGSIYFESGLLQYDYVKSEAVFIDIHCGKEKVVYSKKENYDQQYVHQMKEFLDYSKTGYACSFEEGLAVMHIIEKAEESNLIKQEICLV